MNKQSNCNSVLKKVIDYALCIPLFIFSLPIMCIVALAVKIVSPGPTLFIQERIGLNGQLIKVIKFRTMYTDADERLKTYLQKNPEREAEWLQFFKLDNDPRVIPWIGTFLRKSSLDELPNLWNVLRRDLSLVGPRPFPHYHLAEFDHEFQQLRQTVWPGITGLWQVKRGDTDVQIFLDTYYIRNWSIWMDLKILIYTIPVVLFAKKAHY
jgi:lipopolysaccharide/colanic/teichoic acid biosynthesis glycosyltransferase